MNRLRLLTVTGPQAVGAGVPAPEDDHTLPGRKDLLLRIHGQARDPPVLLGQKIHRKVDPAQLTPGDRQIPRRFRSAAEQHGMIGLPHRLRGDCHADMCMRGENDSLGTQ